MRTFGILAFCILTTCANAQEAPPPVPAPVAPSALERRAAYQANLAACVGRAKACDRASLTASDRSYLTYEMGEQKFSARDAEEVVAVRMEGYGKSETVILGRAGGNRHAGDEGRRRPLASGASRSNAAALASPRGCTVHVEGYYRRNGRYVSAYDRRSSRC